MRSGSISESNVAGKIAIPYEINIVRAQHDWTAVILNAVAGNYSFADRRQFLACRIERLGNADELRPSNVRQTGQERPLPGE